MLASKEKGLGEEEEEYASEIMCIYEGTGNPPNVYFRCGDTMGKTDIRRVEFPVYARSLT